MCLHLLLTTRCINQVRDLKAGTGLDSKDGAKKAHGANMGRTKSPGKMPSSKMLTRFFFSREKKTHHIHKLTKN